MASTENILLYDWKVTLWWLQTANWIKSNFLHVICSWSPRSLLANPSLALRFLSHSLLLCRPWASLSFIASNSTLEGIRFICDHGESILENVSSGSSKESIPQRKQFSFSILYSFVSFCTFVLVEIFLFGCTECLTHGLRLARQSFYYMGISPGHIAFRYFPYRVSQLLGGPTAMVIFTTPHHVTKPTMFISI
jgi:hypothetical protein